MLKKIKIFTDGGSRGNPGPSAYGFVVYEEDGTLINETGKYIGINTNNFAEYSAVLEALNLVISLYSPEELIIDMSMDSEIVKRQLTGEYRIKNENLRTIYDQIKALETRFHSISYTHVLRHLNTKADRMVNKALDSI